MPIANKRTLRSGALIFDGVDDYVDVPDSSSLRPSSLTVVCWVRFRRLPSEIGGHPEIACKFESWAGYGILTDGPANEFRFQIGDGSTWYRLDTTQKVEVDRWYHLAMTFDGSVIEGFVDGASVGTLSATLAHTTYSFTVGGDPTFGNWVDGVVDKVRLYNRVLSDQEISDLYNGKDIREGLVLDMPMNEGQGGTAHDYSGEGNDGTIYGARWYGNMPVKRTLAAKRQLAVVR